MLLTLFDRKMLDQLGNRPPSPQKIDRIYLPPPGEAARYEHQPLPSTSTPYATYDTSYGASNNEHYQSMEPQAGPYDASYGMSNSGHYQSVEPQAGPYNASYGASNNEHYQSMEPQAGPSNAAQYYVLHSELDLDV